MVAAPEKAKEIVLDPKRRLTLAVASGSPAAIQCVLARDQKHGEVLRTAQGAVPFVRLLDEDSDVGAGASEDGVT